MKERPILFSAPMVRAILAGTKTQTRRVVKPVGNDDGFVIVDDRKGEWPYRSDDGDSTTHTVKRGGKLYLDETPHDCPYGRPGDHLWVREAFMHEPADYCWEASVSIPCRPASTVYRADYPESKPGEGWKPSIHMPRHLSRILLEVTSVRVERLQDISEADAVAEGVDFAGHTDEIMHDYSPDERFSMLWESINGAGSWNKNPWVWVVEFRRVEA